MDQCSQHDIPPAITATSPTSRGTQHRLPPWIILVSVNRSASLRNREEVDDDILIARLADGDDTALRVLFSRHVPMLATRLRAVLPAADVEDVLQETFVGAWRGARRYRSEGTVGGWLWGIARVQAALLLRRQGQAGLSLSDVDAVERRTGADPADAIALRGGSGGGSCHARAPGHCRT
jgi:Sigma-70 region 2